MSLVTAALKRPVSTVVIIFSVILFSVITALKIPIDIFPKLNMPTVYVIESYGGMSAQQMEGFFATRMQDQFLYVNGIRNISSKSIQGVTIIKLEFYENTDMAEASAQISTQVNRAMRFFPPGSLPPQVVRFDASSLPVGQLVLSAERRTLKEIYDLASTRVRPMFSSIPGLSAPPPLGANSRSITVNVDPNKLRSYNLTADEVVNALAKFNVMSPSGNIRLDNTTYITTINSLVQQIEEFADIPVMAKNGVPVLVKDVARVADGTDITVDYALINGKRSVYIPVVKTADASTWDVVKDLKIKIPEIKDLLPEDVNISYEFDQSVFVANAVKSLMTEGALGALLTGLMVLLFLRDLRSSLIVVITIPASIAIGVLLLSLNGQTINIMTLSGLALAIGILVDMSTVTIENIHQHLEMGKNKRQAILDGCQEIAFPLLLILLCILAVFAPALMMNGVPKAMFLPLSLSIGFTMIVAFIVAQTLVPILSNWMVKEERYRHARKATEKKGGFEKLKGRYLEWLGRMMPFKKPVVIGYSLLTVALVAGGFYWIGKDVMPKLNNGQFQLRIKDIDGTRLERTEEKVRRVLQIIDTTVNNNVAISSAYVGLIPSSYGTSNLYVFNTGTHEAILQVNLSDKFKVNMDELKDVLRKNIKYNMPELRLSFEPIDLTEKIMSLGAATPIEVQVAGKDMDEIQGYAYKVLEKMKELPFLRDVQIAQPLRFPVVNITLDRLKVAQFGLNVQEIARSVTASTSSSRFTEKNQWLDEKKAYTYQIQVQIPEYVMNNMNELREIPLVRGQRSPVLGDIASFSTQYVPGQYDRVGPRRILTISANIHQTDLGSATEAVRAKLDEIEEAPRGVVVSLGGMSRLLEETFSSLENGLLFAVVVIFLLLATNYQSFKLSLTVLSTVPAVILGSLGMLLLTGSTLNLQSYMGMIMSTGVSVANAILIVTNAEVFRLQHGDAKRAATESAAVRMRPILMTTIAMVAGMTPMALGVGEAGEQSAPLGRAVIGGLIASTFAALLVLPQVFAWVQKKATLASPSLLPETTDQSIV
ncbi:MAG: efflux RND transporter permease subunit [Chitinophagaceae bacterium]|nr:efflux RND transporter permease subunit [Chitinophagaceae bacterium]